MFYEAHSQGSWTEALLALQPHLLAATLFLTHLWANPFAVAVVFGAVLLVALYGWTRGRPNWVYPWLGYTFSPFVATIFYSRDFVYNSAVDLVFGPGLSANHVWLLLFLGLYALFIWLVVFSVVRVVKRDWLLVSYMLLPLPLFGVWISEAARIGAEFYSVAPAVFHWDGGMFTALLILGIVSAVFVRLRRRVLRVVVLVCAGVSSTLLLGKSILETSGFLGVPTLVGLALFTFLVPALLEWVLGHGEPVLGATRTSGRGCRRA